MAHDSERGQVLVELVVVALVFLGVFLMAISAGQTAEREHGRFRFSSSRGSHRE
jgi:hypothetical protein